MSRCVKKRHGEWLSTGETATKSSTHHIGIRIRVYPTEGSRLCCYLPRHTLEKILTIIASDNNATIQAEQMLFDHHIYLSMP
jgi:hypothetical protein